MRARKAQSMVRVLEADPDLARELAPSAVAQARAEALAPLVRLARGRWIPPSREVAQDTVALLVLDGLLVRAVSIDGRRGAELLGPGDVLRPWQTGADGASFPYDIVWSVAAPTSIAAIGRDLVRRWPDVAVELIDRGVDRARSIGIMLAIGRLSSAHERVVALLWHLADRFGHVEPAGVRLPLRLDQTTLGDLVHLGRQAVSSELAALGREGILERRGAEGWLLHGEPPARFADNRTAARTVARTTPWAADRRAGDAAPCDAPVAG
jgi:hypothetical protein